MRQVTAAIDAIKRDDAEQMRALLRDDPSLAVARAADGLSVLTTAAYHSRKTIVELLLATGPLLDIFEASTVGRADRVGGDPPRRHGGTPSARLLPGGHLVRLLPHRHRGGRALQGVCPRVRRGRAGSGRRRRVRKAAGGAGAGLARELEGRGSGRSARHRRLPPAIGDVPPALLAPGSAHPCRRAVHGRVHGPPALRLQAAHRPRHRPG